MSFIVIEGLDGAGKSTQIQRLKRLFDTLHIDSFYLHFPRPDAPVFGELISRFLRGEFGAKETVDPYLVSLIYAGDRKDAAPVIQKNIEAGRFVLVDRYVLSNIAYQCSKLPARKDQERLRKWILHLEYTYYQIPKPDLNIFLDVPFQFTREKLTGERKGTDRSYLDGSSDIHEKDLDFQQKVRAFYLSQSAIDETVRIVNCINDNGDMLNPDEIFQKIHTLLRREKIL